MEHKPARPTDLAFRGDGRHGQSTEPNYSGALSFLRRRYSRDLAGVDAVVWGVPLDVATSNRPGARFGPQAIRRASAILDGDPVHPFGFDPFERLHVVDWGDCVWDYGRPESIPGEIEAQARGILASGVHLVTLGGDHFLTYPLLKAHAARHGPLALVQFDAHQDTWPDDGRRIDHGTMVLRAVREGLVDPDRSIQIGIRTQAPDTAGIEVLDAFEANAMGPGAIAERIRARVAAAPAYLTFDIDCLDPAFAPGTGTPVCGGLSSAAALATIADIGDLDWRGMDVVEVAPAYDHADITALAAATIAQFYFCLIAAKRRPIGTNAS